MRGAILLGFVLGGCLSAPTGRTRDAGGDDVIDAGPDAEPEKVWPPPGDVDFVAIATGDVAGDAAEDVIAINVGDDRPGAFLLVTGVDLDPGVEGLGDTYSAHYAETFVEPVAATIVSEKIVILDNPTTGARMTVLDTDLALVASFTTGGPVAAAGAPQRFSPTTIGPNGGSLVFTNGDDARLIDYTALDDTTPTIPAPQAPTGGWSGVQLVDVYGSASLVFLAAFATTAHTCPVPMGGPMDPWTQERTSGTTWSAQITGPVPDDTVDDGVVDLIGVDPDGANPAKICVLDVVANTTATTCLTTSIPTDMGHVLVHDEFAPGAELDLAVISPGPTDTKIDVFPKLRVTGTMVVADTSPALASFPGADAHVATADLDTAVGPRVFVLLASDGALTCATTKPEGTLDCAD